MDPLTVGLIGAGVGTAANLLGGLFQGNRDKQINREQIEYNKWALAQQERYNWDMWNATNAYNDPSAEKARYARAGINPAVMFKSGLTDQASLGSGIDPEAYNPHPVRTPFDGWMNGNNPISEYQKMMAINKAKVDIENTKMDTKKKEAEKNKLDEDANLVKIQERTEAAKATIAEIDAKYHEQIVQAGLSKQYEDIKKVIQDVENAKTQNDLMKSEKALNESLENLNNWKAKEIKELLQPQIEAIRANVKKALADAFKAYQEGNLASAKTETENQLRPLLKSSSQESINKLRKEIKGQTYLNALNALEVWRKSQGIEDDVWNDIYRQFSSSFRDGDEMLEFLDDALDRNTPQSSPVKKGGVR